MKPLALIFDLDGTLIDSREDLAAGINHMRGLYELQPLRLETVCGFIGDGARKLVERSLTDTGIDADEALHCFKRYYMEHLTVHTRLYEGVSEGIRQLSSAGHQLAVLTNKPGEPSRKILEHFNLASYFDPIIGGGDAPRLKPEPDGIYSCLEKSGLGRSDTWMIGDHCTDLQVADNAGVHSAFVHYGFGEQRGLNPDVEFASFQELVGYFV